jgi:hypothetical protein
MNKSLVWLPLAALALVVAGCAGSEYESASGSAGAGDSGNAQAVVRNGGGADAPLTEMSTTGMAASKRQVIRNGVIGLRVEDVERAERQISAMVAKGGGYVENTSSNDLGGNAPTIEMTVRVPSTGFEDSMATLAGLGHVLSKSVDAKDVTAEIVDLGARIKTLGAKEETFREMLKASRNIDDVMSLQEKLSQVRMEIERMDAQRKSLSDLASLSTIKISLTQTATVPTVASTDPNWFNQNLGSATTSFMAASRGIVGFLTWAVVFSPFWLLPILGLAWLVKKATRRVPPVMQ